MNYHNESVVQTSCLICHRQAPTQQNTLWKCIMCGMPMCLMDHTNNPDNSHVRENSFEKQEKSYGVLGYGIVAWSHCIQQWHMSKEYKLYRVSENNDNKQ